MNDDQITAARARAMSAAQRAIGRGFLREGNADWLMRRGIVGAMRTLSRSGLTDPWTAIHGWLFDVPEPGAIDLGTLPRDGSWLTIATDDDLICFLDDVLPLPDDPDAVPLLQKLGLETESVIRVFANHGADELLVSRLTHAGRDRWFRYWGGKAQDGNYDLSRSTPADNSTRARQILRWVRHALDGYGAVHRLEVNAAPNVTAAAAELVAKEAPNAVVSEWGGRV